MVVALLAVGRAGSLSARRAWIEIFIIAIKTPIGCVVALRKESVDRNMVVALLAVGRAGVALRKESVDRNNCKAAETAKTSSRSPQGERG